MELINVGYIGKQTGSQQIDYYIYFPDRLTSDILVICWNISSHLGSHYKLYKMGLRSADVNIGIIGDRSIVNKFKEADSETTLERLLWACSKFKSTELNISFNIFATNEHIPYRCHENTTGLWQFQERWQGDGNYIVYIKPNKNRGRNNGKGFPMMQPSNDVAFNQFVSKYKWDVIPIDHSMKYQDIFDLCTHCKFMYGEPGGLVDISCFLQCPCIVSTKEPCTLFFENKNRLIHMSSFLETMDTYSDYFKQELYESPLYNSHNNTSLEEFESWIL